MRVASGYKFVWTSSANPFPTDPGTGMPASAVPGMGAIPPPVALDPTTGLPAVGKENQTPLYILTEVPSGMGAPGRLVEVFNLTDYFASPLGSGDEETNLKRVEASLEEIKRIVTSTLQVTDEDHNSTVSFQFHSGANLLVVAGTPDAVEVARKVVNALAPQARPGGIGAMRNDPWGNPYQGSAPGGFVNAFGAVSPGPRMSAASSKARRAIQNKLETIRLDSVLYDGLPLPEVVRNLIDEKTDTFIWTAHTEGLGLTYVNWLTNTEESIRGSYPQGSLAIFEDISGPVGWQVVVGPEVLPYVSDFAAYAFIRWHPQPAAAVRGKDCPRRDGRQLIAFILEISCSGQQAKQLARALSPNSARAVRRKRVDRLR